MTDSADVAAVAQSMNADDVADFLRQNPGFFNSHVDVLIDAQIPHPSGQAISLFDRQLSALRDENRRLKSNIGRMIENARANEALIRRIHGLVLQLMEATGPHAIFSTLQLHLTEHFKAERIKVLVFAGPSFIESNSPPEFVGHDDSRKSAFQSLFEHDRALCQNLQDNHRAALWPDEPAIGGSVALLPLNANAWHGVIAIQSDDAARFSEDMGTEFLSYISDIVCLIVDPWIKREPR